MSINWEHIRQSEFDRTVEVLIQKRFKDVGTVTVPDGRGGDGGIDVLLVTHDAHRRIFQLKYFPEGFSSGWAVTRRPQIKKSYTDALKHNPDEWTLVVPRNLTTPERDFVEGLNGGTKPPTITIVGRAELDDWLSEDPALDGYLQRSPDTELRAMATTYNVERAALLAGWGDVVQRVRDLGSVIDRSDPDWTFDFGRVGAAQVLAVRPQHPGASERNPITFTVETTPLGDDRAALVDHVQRELGYGTSTPVVIPGDAVASVAFTGPEFLAGHWPPGTVRIEPNPHLPALGKLLELKVWHEDELVVSYEGTITHAGRGDLGGTIDTSFFDGRLTTAIRLAHDDDLGSLPDNKALHPGISLKIQYKGSDHPEVVANVLAAARVIRAATRLEIFLDGELAATMSGFPPLTIDDYGQDLLTIEQYAGDLAVVQQHCNQFFGISEYIQPGDRVAMRVARLLAEGHIVASPKAPIFTIDLDELVELTGDQEQTLSQLATPRPIAWRAPRPHTVTVGHRTLSIGDVYVIHHAAVAANADAAIAALRSGNSKGIRVQYHPGDDPFFNLMLAPAHPGEDLTTKKLALWSLIGVDQPGISSEQGDGVEADSGTTKEP